jgi:hypothetical protein
VAGRDITEGLPVNVGNPGVAGFWINNAEDFDVAIGGEPFILAPTDTNPYQRETAPYRKEQFDNSKEPGEQSLTGWWIRSQSSFHGGTGIKFYDPTSGESTGYRFADSRGVDVWTKGQVSLLKDVSQGHNTTGKLMSNGRPFQSLSPIKWNTSEGVLLWDEYDIDKIDSSGVQTHFVDIASGANPAYAVCNDGVFAYWITNDSSSGKLKLNKKLLTLTSVDPETNMFTHPSITVTNAVMDFVKDRIILCANNSVYEMATNATSLPTAAYTNPNTNYVYTSIASSGPAIYTSGYSGLYSTIQKYTLNTSGAIPTLTQASVAAEFPPGEIVYKIYYYLGYMMIGTNKGVRAAIINDQDGSINYGPLIVETTQPCYDFAARDRFVWCATGIGSNAGLVRIDLSTSIENESLRFAYANDLEYTLSDSHYTTAVCFIGSSNRLNFVTSATVVDGGITFKAQSGTTATLTTASAHNLEVGDRIHIASVGAPFDGEFTVVAVPTTTTFTYTVGTSATVTTTAVSPAGAVSLTGFNYQESTGTLVSSGYLTTGAIRYGTLEPKNYKFIRARGNFTNGAMDIATVDSNNSPYAIITYNASIGTPEAATNSPEGPQEYLSYKFTLSRSASNTSLGPTFKGYQAKSLPATKRQRLIQFPVWCYDVETDRYNVLAGYEGRAWERIQKLEDIEAAGDIINVQDFTTGERLQALVERVSFTRKTPPSARYDGFGGLLTITVRTVL